MFQHYPSKNYPNAASTWNIVAAISSQSRDDDDDDDDCDAGDDDVNWY